MSDIETKVTSIVTAKPKTTTIVSVQASPTAVEVVKNHPVIEVVQLGLQGPPGPPGRDGGNSASYIHTQSIPSATWIIVHNLGFRPAGIHVEDSAGDDCEGDVHYDSANQITITFSGAFSGTAYLS